MATQTGSISFKALGGLNLHAEQSYATLSQIKGQFATCGTGKTSAAKAATIIPENSDWTLYTGATITVKFLNENTEIAPTLNVNNTGAKPIRDYNGNELMGDSYKWKSNVAMSFVYDGTYWRIQDTDLIDRLHSAETDIDQTATSITSLASMQDNYTRPDGFTATNNIKSYVNQTAEGITTTISQLNNTVKHNGRNLLLNGDFSQNMEVTTIANDYGLFKRSDVYTIEIDDDIKHNGFRTLKIVGSEIDGASKDILWNSTVYQGIQGEIENESFTFSFWAKASTSAKLWAREAYGSYINRKSVDLTTDWDYYSIIITGTSADNYISGNDTTAQLIFYIDTACTVYLSECKLEYGIIATSWDQAPEDIYITSNKVNTIKQTVDENSSTITSLTETVKHGGVNLLNEMERAYDDGPRTNKDVTIEYIGEGWWTITGTVNTTSNFVFDVYGHETDESKFITMNPGTYTVSMEYTGTAPAQGTYRIQCAPSNVAGDNLDTKLLTSVTTHQTFDAEYAVKFVRVHIHTDANGVTLNGKFRVKLEHGEIVTPWEYSPSDTTVISNTVNEVKQTANTNSAKINQVTTTVQNLDSGGRNLLYLTRDFAQKEGETSGGYLTTATSAIVQEKYNNLTVRSLDYTLITTSTYTSFASYQSVLVPKMDKTYCLSFYAKGSGTIMAFFYHTSNNGGVSGVNCKAVTSQGSESTAADGHVDFTLSDTWTRYWVKWTPGGAQATLERHVLLRICGGNSASVCGLMFEEAAIPSNWTPAPEDLDGAIVTLTTKTSEITQTLDGVKTVIGYSENQQGQGSSTLVTKVNEIDETVDGHTQSIESVTTTLTKGGSNLVGNSATYDKWLVTNSANVTFDGEVVDINVANDGANHFHRAFGYLVEENLTSGTFTLSFEVYCDDWSGVGSSDDSDTGYHYAVIQLCYRDGTMWPATYSAIPAYKRYRYMYLSNTAFWSVRPTQENSKWLRFVSVPMEFPTAMINDTSKGTGPQMTVEPMLRGWGHVKFRHIQVERGEIATTWSPSPYDLTSIDRKYAEYVMTNEEFKTKVGHTIAESVRNVLINCANPKVGTGYWSASSYAANPTGLWYTYNAKGTLSKTEDGVKMVFAGGDAGIVIPLVDRNAVVGGETLTLSYIYRGTITSTGTPYILNATGSNSAQSAGTMALIGDGNWHSAQVTWTAVRTTTDAIAFLLTWNHGGAANSWFEVKDGSVILERGDLAKRVSIAETSITQTANAIGLTAMGTATIANPNLSPFFEYLPFGVSGSSYWVSEFSTAAFTALDDGWAHFKRDNSSGSSVSNNFVRMVASPVVKDGGVYTCLVEIRNITTNTATSLTLYIQQTSAAQFWGTGGTGGYIDGYDGWSINNSSLTAKSYYLPMKARAVSEHSSSGTRLMDINWQVPAGAKIECDIRISLYEGEYTGPWKPYAGSQLYTSQAELKITADGITSEVSKIGSVKYATTSYSRDLATLKNWAAEGHSDSWNIVADNTIRVGDTVYVKCQDTTRSCPVFIKVTVTAVNSSTSITGISHGYEDVLPVNTIVSTINQSAESVKIAASKIEIDGTTTFKSGNTSTNLSTYLGDNYDPKGAANNIKIGGRNFAMSPFQNVAQTSNGLTCTCIGPSTVRVNGTATAVTSTSNISFLTPILEPGTYSLWLTNTNNGTIWFRLGKGSSNTHIYSTQGNYIANNPYIFEVTESNFYTFYPVMANGSVFTNFETSYMLEKGNKASSWTLALEDMPAINLAPFFSFEPYDTTTGQGGQYWNSFSNGTRTAMGDGWVKIITTDNTSGSSTIYSQHRPKSHFQLSPNTVYTLMIEFRNVSKTGNVYLRCPDSGQSGAAANVVSLNGVPNSSIDLAIANGTYYKVFSTPDSSATNYSTFFGLCTRVDAGAKVTYELRLSIYEGVYYGLYQTYTGHAVLQEQRIYYRSNSTTAPAAPTAFVTSTTTSNTTWTTKRMPYDSTYKYLYTTMQRKHADGNTSCGLVLLDDTTTVIDGGSIITNSIDANKMKANSLTIGYLTTETQNNILNSKVFNALNGYTILWNYEAFSTANNGEAYICKLDPASGTKSDANGTVMWNGITRTITKGMINPDQRVTNNASTPVAVYNIPVYIVCRLSSADSTTGTNYIVWYSGAWRYAGIGSGTAAAWTWNDATDIVLGKYVETSSDAAFIDYEIYDPPWTSKQVTTNTVTAGGANSTANSANTKVNYYNRSCYVGNSSNTQTNFWRKFASLTATGTNTDYVIIFDVISSGDMSRLNRQGRLEAHLRTSGTVGTIAASESGLFWHWRGDGMALTDFVFAYKATSGTNVLVELWCSCPTSWIGYQFIQVEEYTRTEVRSAALWTLNNSWTADGSASITSGYTQITSKDTSNAFIQQDTTGIKVHNSDNYNDFVKISSSGVEVRKGGNLKADYADIITLYGGNGTNGANPKITIGESITDGGTARLSMCFYDNGGTRRIKLNSGVGLIIGKEDRGRIQITDAGAYIYDFDDNRSSNKSVKRIQITTEGLNVYDTDGSTNVANFGATARIGTTTSKHITVNTNGLHVWIGAESTATNEVAVFSGTARIGATNTGHVEVTSTGVGLYNKNNKMKVSIGTGNSIFYGGEATYPYIEVSNSSTGAINIKQSATAYSSITSSGLTVYTTVNSAAKKVASFGATTQIGQDSKQRIVFTASDGIQIFDDSNKLTQKITNNSTNYYFDISGTSTLGLSVRYTGGSQIWFKDENYLNFNHNQNFLYIQTCSETTENNDLSTITLTAAQKNNSSIEMKSKVELQKTYLDLSSNGTSLRINSSGATLSNTLILTKTTDAAGTANNSPALIVGGTATTAHLEFDNNEIMAKSNGTTTTTLYLNSDGGLVQVGSGGFNSVGTIKQNGTAVSLSGHTHSSTNDGSNTIQPEWSGSASSASWFAVWQSGTPVKIKAMNAENMRTSLGLNYITEAPSAYTSGTTTTATNSFYIAAGDALGTTSGTTKNLKSFKLDAGKWLIIAEVWFTSNTSGRRSAKIGTSNSDIGSGIGCQKMAPASGDNTEIQIVRYLYPTTATPYYLNCYQNSGSSLNAGSYVTAIRLG